MEVLNIRTRQPQIGMETQRGKLEMTTPPITLDIDHGATTVDIHTIAANLEIDQYPSRASYGILSTTDRILQTYQQAKQQANEGIARRAEEGTQFLKNPHVSSIIGNREKSKLSEMPTMEVKLCQVAPPTINYTPSQVKFDVNVRPLSLKVNNQPVSINYTRPEVNVYLKQKSDVKMWVSEDKYDIYA
jgi:hypothetical protein